jgi:hypothetical protein
MSTPTDPSHVAMLTRRFCGGTTNSLALSTRIVKDKHGKRKLEDLPSGPLYDEEPCEDCKKRFDEGYRYFIGDCGHSGFVRYTALQKLFTSEGLKNLGDHKIFRMEKCFTCLGVIPPEFATLI